MRYLEIHLLLVHSDTVQTHEAFAEANENKEQKNQNNNNNKNPPETSLKEGTHYQVQREKKENRRALLKRTFHDDENVLY